MVKQVVGATVGFFLGGPVGALQGFQAGSAWDANDKAKKAQKVAAASQARIETSQRKQISSADADRKRLLQEGSTITRRRGPLTTYSGAS